MPLDERGIRELHAARARISFCMLEKKTSRRYLSGVVCAMTPLLAKSDYRPSREPTVASVDGEIFYRLSNRTMLEGERKNTRKDACAACRRTRGGG